MVLQVVIDVVNEGNVLKKISFLRHVSVIREEIKVEKKEMENVDDFSNESKKIEE